MNKQDLIHFLLKASKSGYAIGYSTFIREKDQSYSTKFEEGGFRFHDNWFGGEPFGGREVVFYQNKPYWMMVYYGSDSAKAPKLIPFLQKALSLPPRELPVRGPKLLDEKDFKYVNTWKGTIKYFEGKEVIYYKDREVYHAFYGGGLVDKREDQL